MFCSIHLCESHSHSLMEAILIASSAKTLDVMELIPLVQALSFENDTWLINSVPEQTEAS